MSPRERRALRVTVQDATQDNPKPPAAAIRRWAKAAAGSESGGELVVRIVRETESAELNGHYRGRNAPTNVLAFPAEFEIEAPEDEPVPLGDLAICAAVVEREAAEQGKSLDAHWAHIVMHGVLHLLGYDHEIDADAVKMENRERELLAGFGIDDPYRHERE